MATKRRLHVFLATLTLIGIALGCEGSGNEGNGQGIILPEQAKLGETVSMIIDSNYIPFLPQTAFHTLSVDNVTVRIDFGPTVVATFPPLAVFHAEPTATSQVLEELPGAEVAIVVFNLPDPLPALTLPETVIVKIEVDGQVSPLAGNDLFITGDQGQPMAFKPAELGLPAILGPRPGIRLRARYDAATGAGFDPAWTDVASIELTLDYPTGAVSQPEVFGASEVRNANGLVGPDNPAGSVRIVLAEPNGFDVAANWCLPPAYQDCRMGAGPWVDVSFDLVPQSPGFAASDFTIRGLAVYDRDGVLLSPAMGPTDPADDFFEVLPINNGPEGS